MSASLLIPALDESTILGQGRKWMSTGQIHKHRRVGRVHKNHGDLLHLHCEVQEVKTPKHSLYYYYIIVIESMNDLGERRAEILPRKQLEK